VSASDPMAGTLYRTRGVLGSGSTARVLEVEHVTLKRLFVVKLLNAKLARDERVLDRFMGEARFAAAVRHQHLVEVVNFGWTDHDLPFLVMERLVGRNLRQELDGLGRLPLSVAIPYLRQACSALAAAHARGIVHRDVKPENLFLHEKKTGERVLIVLDLGLAKILADVTGAPEPREFSTEKDSWVGTVRYAAPEQAWGTDVDGRLDIYALGVVAYETLTGHGPFDHLETDAELLQAHAMIEPRPPSKLARDLGRRVDRVILKALAKNREDRYQTAEEFSAALATLENVATPLLIPEIAAGTALGAAISAYFMLKLWWPAP